MTVESGFFNSVSGDRLYNAEAFNEIFEGMITNGVFNNVGAKLAVTPNSGMTIQVGTGRGWFNNHWIKNTSAKLITLEASDVILNRYAAIIVRLDTSNSVRSMDITVKYSSFASNPTKPSMTRSGSVYEYCLAYVYIKAGASSITASNIQDTRFNSSLCGWVTTLIDELDTDTIYAQWEAAFNEWFTGLQDLIDENVETTLVNALPTAVTVSLPVSGWTKSGSVYTQTVTVSNMNTTKSVIVQPNSPGVECTAQATDKLTFTAEVVPDATVTVKVTHMGV